MGNRARQALCEHLVVCQRLDRILILGLRLLAKSLGIRVLFTRIHMTSVYYGDNEQGLKMDRWWYRGQDLYPVYYTMGHAYVDYVLEALKERERGSNMISLHRDNEPLSVYPFSKVSRYTYRFGL